MKNVSSIEFRGGSKEELLPNLDSDFPYICSRAELDKFIDQFVPWHWHKEVELFYIEEGGLEYHVPKGKMVFPAGSGGLVNSGVLHMTKQQEGIKETTQVEHIFDTAIIAGQQGSRIEQKYVIPFVTAPQIEVFGIYPENQEQRELLTLLRESFQLSEDDPAYEIKLRAMLSEIWYRFLVISEPLRKEKGNYDKSNDKIKLMMVYMHEHYAEKLSIAKLAAAVFISERECFRVFKECLHMTPIEYLKEYRLQKACYMLAESREAVTDIGLLCGLGSGSYFGKVFRENRGCTPIAYRNKWQNNDTKWQK